MRNYTDEELDEINGRTVTFNGQEMSLCEATQKQRSIERNIRKYKRESAGMKAVGKDTAEADAKVRQWQGKQRDFLKQTGLRRDYSREQIPKVTAKPINRTFSIKQPYAETDFTANKAVIESDEYINKYKGITKMGLLGNKRIMDYAKKAIYENDGTEDETLYFLSAFSGSSKAKPIKLGAYGANGIKFPFKKPRKNSLIFLHNHPNSVAFSFDDFVTLNDFPEIKTMIAAGHDGTVYVLSVGNGKRLDIPNQIVYDDYEREWHRLFAQGGNSYALEQFVQKWGWNFEKR